MKTVKNRSEKFWNFPNELIETMHLLFTREENYLSGLIILYTTIDIMAWLDRAQGDSSQTNIGEQFRNWVDEYLLKGEYRKTI